MVWKERKGKFWVAIYVRGRTKSDETNGLRSKAITDWRNNTKSYNGKHFKETAGHESTSGGVRGQQR
jgi:hypothetical protein